MALTYADIKKWGLARLSDVTGGTAGVASFNTRTGAVTAVTADLTDSTAAGRSLVTAADAAAQRTALGLGTAATQASTAFATAAQGAKADTAVQSVVTASLSTNYTLQASDDGKEYYCTTALTVSVPDGLSPRPNVGFELPPTGSLTIQRLGTVVTINGGTAPQTRTRLNNPVGIFLHANHDADSYGLSGG